MPAPDRWEEYQPLGSVIPGTKFIAFKVPLKEEICRNLPEKLSFSPAKLIQDLTDSGKSLGLVVDLTFTHRYYNGREFTKHSIQHEKIFTKGHEVPSEDVYSRFGEVVDAFYKEHGENDVLIGVHCTHGVNRTGYLVCRYMIERLKIPPDEAITLFNEARGHRLERENYIADLKTRPRSSDAGPPLSMQVTGQLRSIKKSDHRRHQPPPSRQDRDRSPHTDYQNRGQNHRSSTRGNDGPDRQNSGHSRRGYHDDSRDRGHRRNVQSADIAHVSPLDRLDDPPQRSWGSGCAGWGAPAVARGHNRNWPDRAGGEWHREPHSSPHSSSHWHQNRQDLSRRGHYPHWRRDLGQYKGERDVSKYSWRRGASNYHPYSS